MRNINENRNKNAYEKILGWIQYVIDIIGTGSDNHCEQIIILRMGVGDKE